tara:strand:- start:11294 stop:12367 length:1074 start_codon:yes stop_codon:yes gene_type:complete
MAVYTQIDDPSANFQIATWSGSGSTQSITNDGNSDLQPDWVWTKPRGIAFNHALMDSSRGVGSSGKVLVSNSANAEFTIDDYVTALNSDGFSVGAGDAGFNASNDTYVSWQWKANGGTTSSNSDGSITSTVQANTTAGFSIVTYTGTGSAATIGHGLGKAPAWIVVKSRTTSANWTVRHHSTTNNYDFLSLNTTDAATANDGAWTQTDPTTSVFSIGTATSVNQNTIGYIAYCFAEIQGFSKFGKYTASGDANGPFIHLGFKPAFIMTKRTDTAGYHWRMYDAKRNPFNVVNARLSANNNDTEYSGTSGNEHADFLSNGFKWKTAASDQNVSGGTYVYMAFAENPFVTSTGIPTTAR